MQKITKNDRVKIIVFGSFSNFVKDKKKVAKSIKMNFKGTVK